MVTITPPLESPSITTSLSAGGTLVDNTKYYVMVTAHDKTSISNFYHVPSSGSNIATVTTDTTNKSIDINWTAIPGASAYICYIATATGLHSDWQKKPDYILSLSTTGTNYLISHRQSAAGWDTCTFDVGGLSTSALPLGIDHKLGRIVVNITGTETLQNIANVITSSGYGEFIHYSDGFFGIKGDIVIDSGEVGSLTISNTHLILLDKGIFINNSDNFDLQFGEDSLSGFGYNGCIFDSMGGGFNYQKSSLYNATIVHNMSNYGYAWSSGNWTPNFRNIIDNDALFTNGTEWSNYGITGLTVNNYAGSDGGYVTNPSYIQYQNVYNGATVQQWSYTVHYRECDFKRGLKPAHAYAVYNGVLTGDTQGIFFYDCTFDTSDNLPIVQYNYATNDKNHNIYYSYNAKILDEYKNPISNARIIIKNDNDETLHSVETNINGEVSSLDVLITKINHDISSGVGMNMLYIHYNPVTVTISKQGYQTYKATYEWTSKQNLIITLYSSTYSNMNRNNN